MRVLSPHLLLLTLNWLQRAQADVQMPILDSLSSISSMLKLHRVLVDQESVSGHEASLVRWLVSYLEDRNFTVETQLVEPASDSHGPRENILAYLGKQRNTRTIVTSHIDTVPPFIPYERIGDMVWGRGSVDAKACIATQLTAVERLIAQNKLHEGDVGLLFVVDEEVNGSGMRKANDLGLKPRVVIFGEPTDLKLASGHKGLIIVDIIAKGKAGHSGYPWLGRNANDLMITALNALQNIDFPQSEKFGNTTINIGKLRGGVAPNVIAEYAEANIAIRIANGSLEMIKTLVLDALEEAAQDVEVVFKQGYAPVSIDTDVEGFVFQFISPSNILIRKGFETIVVNYGTDIPNLQGDWKRYLYGPGSILLAHSSHEHVKIADLVTAVRGYTILIEQSLS